MNVISRATIFGGLLLLAAVTWAWSAYIRSPYATEQLVLRQQPVQFSHEHHAGGLGIHCLYCHTGVEESPFAGIPPTQICMNCHRQVWADSPELEPVRSSFRDNTPIEWVRVHDLADFVYFNHSIHVHKGVGCETCHGRVDQMPLMWKAESLQMEWCLDCHRTPENFLRPLSEIYTMGWKPGDQQAVGRRLVQELNVDSRERLTNCSICHR